MSEGKNQNNQKLIVRILEKIIWAGAFLSLLTPLIFSGRMMFPFITPRSFFFMAVVQIIFWTWLLLAFKDERYRPKFNLVTGSVLAFLVVIVLSTVLGVDPSHSFWADYERMLGALMHLHLLALFLVLSLLFKKEEDWLKIIDGTTIVAVLVALISLADNLGLFPLPDYHQDGSTLGNTSFMGSYLLMAAFFCLYARLKTGGPKRIFYGLSFIIISSGVLFNPGGRAMKGAFVLGIILLLALYLAFSERRKYVTSLARVFLGVGVIMALAIGVLAFVEGSFIREKIIGLPGMAQRFVVWEMTMAGIRERPLLGWGLENYHLIFARKFDPRLAIPQYGAEVWFDRAHNVVFDNLATVGILGTILFFGMFLTALFVFWREFFRNKIEIWAPAVFTSLLVAHFVQNLTVFDMLSSYMFLFLILAFAASLSPQKESGKLLRPAIIPTISIVILFIFSFNFFVVSPYRSNINASLAMVSPLDEATSYYQKGKECPIGWNELTVSFAERLINETAQDDHSEEKKEAIGERMRELKKDLKELTERPSVSFKEYWIIGRLYNQYYHYYLLDKVLYGESEKQEEFLKQSKEVIAQADKFLTRAIKISPRNQKGYWDLSQAKINMGNIYRLSDEIELGDKKFQEAFFLTEKAVQLEPRHLLAHFKMLRIAAEILKDPDLARKKAQEALEIEPLWQPVIERFL